MTQQDATAVKRKLRTILFSTLYPSSVKPGHGIFVETRLRELLRSGEIETRVVAPVPWFFSTNSRYGQYALMARTPAHERRNDIEILHPRYMLPPKIGMTIAPFSIALGAIGAIRELQRQGFDFDLIDAHYCYPDGVAAAILAKWLDKPYVMTARGSDLNLIGKHAVPRRLMQWAARGARACIGVSAALTEVFRAWGLPAERRLVIRNGVDLVRFRPMAQDQARSELGITGGPVLLSVGNLMRFKGHHIVMEALARIIPDHPDAHLLIVGEGPDRQHFKELACQMGIDDRVRFAGAQPNEDLYRWYSAADALVLASSREGWANVLLEAMACGTPVVASSVGGTPEFVSNGVAGQLVDQLDSDHFALSINALLRDYPDRMLVRAYAEKFSWHATTDAQLDLFHRIATVNP